ncbi:MAG: transporter substrate-binding domain-containing protein [Clostridiales bacterium]|nr:transporter substrate-binding domain-containing protein [Clostridiales bacterium]
MKNMKRTFALILVVVMVLLSITACGGSDSDSAVDTIKENGKIVMLTNAAFAPFEYMEGNTVVGVDADIAAEIAKELGVELEIVNMDFDSIIDFVKTEKGDFGAAGITVNEERKAQVDFSVEYVTSTQYVIIPADQDPATYDLNGKIIGVQQGTTGDMYYASVTDTFTCKEVKRYKSAVDAANDMKAGRVDCVIIDELPAKKIVENNADTMLCYDPGWAPEDYAIAVKKGSDLLPVINTVLERLMDEGMIEEYVINHTGA